MKFPPTHGLSSVWDPRNPFPDNIALSSDAVHSPGAKSPRLLLPSSCSRLPGHGVLAVALLSRQRAGWSTSPASPAAPACQTAPRSSHTASKASPSPWPSHLPLPASLVCLLCPRLCGWCQQPPCGSGPNPNLNKGAGEHPWLLPQPFWKCNLVCLEVLVCLSPYLQHLLNAYLPCKVWFLLTYLSNMHIWSLSGLKSLYISLPPWCDIRGLLPSSQWGFFFLPRKCPSLSQLPVVPPMAGSPFSPLLWQGQWMPSTWGSLPCRVAFRSQFCVCFTGKPLISSLCHHKDCLQSSCCPAISSSRALTRLWPDFTSAGYSRGRIIKVCA